MLAVYHSRFQHRHQLLKSNHICAHTLHTLAQAKMRQLVATGLLILGWLMLLKACQVSCPSEAE